MKHLNIFKIVALNMIGLMRVSSAICGVIFIFAATTVCRAEPDAPLYSDSPGENPSFQQLIDSGAVVVGTKRGEPIAGTRIEVNHKLLESLMDPVEGTVETGSIHTHVRSGISAKKELKQKQWTRWYQKDGNTQIFRLFKGEQSVRSNDNIKAGRIEFFKSVPNPKPGEWIEWEGTYTIIKPGHGCIFQVMVGKDPKTGKGGLWPMHLDQGPDGSIFMTRRRPKDGEKKKVLIAKDVVGKPVTCRVRFDGKTKYEVRRKIHGVDKDFVFVGAGTYHPHHGDKVGLRWGIYQGSKPGSKVQEDCLLLVTGVQIKTVKPKP
jgi:hypothetical protein